MRVVGGAIEAELQHGHAGQVEAVAQGPDSIGDDPEIFRDLIRVGSRSDMDHERDERRFGIVQPLVDEREIGLDVDFFTEPMATTVDQPMKSPPPGLAPGTALRIAPGRPELSALPQRMASRWPSLQMPPLGTSLVDADAVDLINRWIAGMEEVSTTALHEEGSKQ